MTLRSIFSRWPAPRTAGALGLLLGVYLLLGGLDAILAPAFEKPDEQLHFAYVAFLLEHGQLPPLTTNKRLNPAQQEAGQPPLFYGLAALSARLLGLDPKGAAVEVNPGWGSYMAPGTVNDNKNHFIHASAEYAQPELRIIYVIRALSLLLGAGAILAAYGLARALNASQWLAWCAAAAVTLQPQFLYIAGSVSNDASVTFLSGAALWALIVAARGPSQARRWWQAGLLVGLATLSKTSALWLAAFGSGLALWQAWRRRSARVAAVGIASCVGGVFVCSGWWYARNWAGFGDPLGFGIHTAMLGHTTAWTLESVLAKWLPLGKSFWATFGWGNVELPGWVYNGFRLVEALAAGGLVFGFIKKRPGPEWWGGYALLLLYVAGVLAGLASWMFSTGWVLGRLLFPALVPLAVLAVAGWARLWVRLPAWMLAYLCLVAGLTPVYLQAAFGQPAHLAQAVAPPGTYPTDVRFGSLARLFAYAVSPPQVAPGGQQAVTLCWQALGTTPRNYTLSVQLRGQADSLDAQRDTYPGLGAFATRLWETGDAFCDQMMVPLNKNAPSVKVHRVEVILYDAETMERLPAFDAAGQPLTRVFISP